MPLPSFPKSGEGLGWSWMRSLFLPLITPMHMTILKIRPLLAGSLLVFAFVSCASSLALAQTPEQETGKAWALIIGISQYSKLPGGQQLQDAENDARAFANVLQQSSGFDLQNIWLLAGAGATQTSIKTALGSWLPRQSTEQDTVYIFFSGHSIVDREFGSSYWMAYDSDPKNIDATAISVDDLKRALSGRIKAKRVFLIADCVHRDFFDPESTGPADVAALEKSFADLARSRPGLTCLFASGPGEFSREGRRWKDLGVFTKFVVDGMAGQADRNKDGVITDEELFDFLAERIPQETTQKQHPWRTADTYPPLAISRRHSHTVAALQNGRSSQSPQSTEPNQTQSPAFGAPQSAKNRANEPSPAVDVASPSSSARGSSAGSVSSVNTSTQKPTQASDATAAASQNGSPVSPSSPAASASTESAVPASVPNTAKEPPRQPAAPPSVASVAAVSASSRPVEGPLPTINASPVPAPSPLPFQFDAAIEANHLIAPSDANAWDIYERMAADQRSYELARYKDRLAQALLKESRRVLVADMLQDSITSRSDEIKLAGEMLGRLRQLQPNEEAVAGLQKLASIENLIALEFYQDAEKSLSQIPSPASAPIENAKGLVYLGELSEWQAERSFKRAIEADPTWAAPHYNLALLYKSQGKDAALAEFEQAAKLAPNSGPIVAGLGDQYFSQNRWEDAAAAFTQAIASEPNNDALHTKLGHCLYSQGKHQEADAEYEKARKLAAKNR